jgi:hypothetical protein
VFNKIKSQTQTVCTDGAIHRWFFVDLTVQYLQQTLVQRCRKVATWAATPTHHFTTRRNATTRLSIFAYKVRRRLNYRLKWLRGRA